jgi:hypothetical protein
MVITGGAVATENRQASSWLRRRPAGHHLLGYQDSNLD